MTRTVRVVLVLLVGLAVLAEWLAPDEAKLLDRTTYGTSPWGYRAAYDLLSELGFPIARFSGAPGDLPADATTWWIGPSGVCRRPDAATRAEWAGRAFAEAGGTAVVFLSGAVADRCTLGDLVLPARQMTTPETVDGPGPTRKLGIPSIPAFVHDQAWTARATSGALALVIEAPLGRGRVVAVSDATLLDNQAMASADVAPFAVDLVRAFGPPRVVEARRAMRSPSAAAYLVRSPALALFAGLALTGLLLAWSGSLVPARSLDDSPAPAPTLDTFVDGLAALYAQTGDHARVLQRYREMIAGHLRRRFGFPPEMPVADVVDRVGRFRRLPDDGRALLVVGRAVTTAAELRAAASELDRLANEVVT
jgi:hypothetical protein